MSSTTTLPAVDLIFSEKHIIFCEKNVEVLICPPAAFFIGSVSVGTFCSGPSLFFLSGASEDNDSIVET